MTREPFVRPRCDSCKIKIPKLYSLTCCLCAQIKHLKCQGLTKADATKIWPNRETWSCNECNYGTCSYILWKIITSNDADDVIGGKVDDLTRNAKIDVNIHRF